MARAGHDEGMSPTWESGHPTEDEWWSGLYDDPPGPPTAPAAPASAAGDRGLPAHDAPTAAAGSAPQVPPPGGDAATADDPSEAGGPSGEWGPSGAWTPSGAWVPSGAWDPADAVGPGAAPGPSGAPFAGEGEPSGAAPGGDTPVLATFGASRFGVPPQVGPGGFTPHRGVPVRPGPAAPGPASPAEQPWTPGAGRDPLAARPVAPGAGQEPPAAEPPASGAAGGAPFAGPPDHVAWTAPVVPEGAADVGFVGSDRVEWVVPAAPRPAAPAQRPAPGDAPAAPPDAPPGAFGPWTGGDDTSGSAAGTAFGAQYRDPGTVSPVAGRPWWEGPAFGAGGPTPATAPPPPAPEPAPAPEPEAPARAAPGAPAPPEAAVPGQPEAPAPVPPPAPAPAPAPGPGPSDLSAPPHVPPAAPVPAAPQVPPPPAVPPAASVPGVPDVPGPPRMPGPPDVPGVPDVPGPPDVPPPPVVDLEKDGGRAGGEEDLLGRHFDDVVRATAEPGPARPYAPAPPPEPPAGARPPALPAGWAQVATAHAGLRPAGHALWPAADPDGLADLVPDTVLESGRLGPLTVRAVAARGEEARAAGRPRREALLTARFGDDEDCVLLLAVAGAASGHTGGARVLAALGAAIGTHRAPLLADLRAGREQALRSGLRRMTDRVLAGRGDAVLSAALLPGGAGGPRVFFGTGPGVPVRLRGGTWRPVSAAPGGGFRLTTATARPGDVTLLHGPGLHGPLHGDSRLAARLAARWAPPSAPPDPAAFLADLTAPLPAHGADRTAIALWEAPAR